VRLFVNVSFGCSEFAHGSDHRQARPGFQPSRGFCLHSSAHSRAPVTRQENTEAEALIVWRVPRNVSECGQRHSGESAFTCPRVSHDNQLRSDSPTCMHRVDRDLLNMGSSVHLLQEQVGDDYTVDEPHKRSMVRDEALEILPADRLIIGDYRHVDVAERLSGGSLDLGDPEVVLETGKTSHLSILPFPLRTYPHGNGLCNSRGHSIEHVGHNVARYHHRYADSRHPPNTTATADQKGDGDTLNEQRADRGERCDKN